MRRDSLARLTKIPVRCSNKANILTPCSQYQSPPSPLNEKNRLIQKVNTNYKSAFNDNTNPNPCKYHVQFIERVVVFDTETHSKPLHLNDYQYLIDSSKRNREKRLHQRKNSKSNSKQPKNKTQTKHKPTQLVQKEIIKPIQQIEYQNENVEDDDLTIFPIQILTQIKQKQVNVIQQIIEIKQPIFIQIGVQTLTAICCQCQQKRQLTKTNNSSQIQRCQKLQQVNNKINKSFQSDLNKINQQQKDDANLQVVKQVIVINDSSKNNHQIIEIFDKTNDVLQIIQIDVPKQSIQIDDTGLELKDTTTYQDTLQQQCQGQYYRKRSKILKNQLKYLCQMNQSNPNFEFSCFCEGQNKLQNTRITRSRKTIYAPKIPSKQQQNNRKQKFQNIRKQKKNNYLKSTQNKYCKTCYGLKQHN